MKLKKLLFLSAVVFFIVSCGDKSKDEPENIDLNNPTFEQKTVAETKQDLEQTGAKMINEIKTMNQEKSMVATVTLVDLLSNSNEFSELKKTNVFKVLSAVRNLSGSKPEVKKVMRALQEVGEDNSLLASFDEEAGEYEYDFDSEDFVKVSDNNNIIFRFPSSKAKLEAQELNAVLTINRPEVITGNFPMIETNELPTKILYTLEVDNNVAASFLFTASYNSDGIPTSVETKLAMGTYELKVTYSYSSTKFDVNYSFTHGSTIIFDFGAGVGGNLTKTDIENAEETVVHRDSFLNYYYDENTGEIIEKYDYYEWEENEFYFERVIENANAHFQLMDIKIVGSIDFASLIPEVRKADKDSTYTIEKMAQEINKDVKLVVVYASTNKAIAKAEAYVKVVVDYDYNGNEYTDKEIDFRMIFADQSKSTLDSYFGDVYDGLVNEMNSLISELNETYGWELEPIEKEGK